VGIDLTNPSNLIRINVLTFSQPFVHFGASTGQLPISAEAETVKEQFRQGPAIGTGGQGPQQGSVCSECINQLAGVQDSGYTRENFLSETTVKSEHGQ
jgi:hypothetical protein